MSTGLMSQTDHALSASYRMPVAVVGQNVWWHIDGKKASPPFAGIVTAVNPRALKLAVFEADSVFPRVLDCVRHTDDPALRDLDIDENGAWQHIPTPLPSLNVFQSASIVTPEMENLKAAYERNESRSRK